MKAPFLALDARKGAFMYLEKVPLRAAAVAAGAGGVAEPWVAIEKSVKASLPTLRVGKEAFTDFRPTGNYIQ
ncbi:hypothetical protein ED92_00505 [Amycolatopsis sp. MJM2582]|nr:hypothetical protein ED92_00505 [Amycolatopsis sp. MJM2582]